MARSKGLSLIELMIAMAVGLVLLLGLVQVMSASRTAYQLSTGVARTQESARFAMDSIQRDARMAGHLGCVNDQARMQAGMESVRLKLVANDTDYAAAAVQARFDIGLQGFEAQGTAPGAAFTLPSTPAPATDPARWSPRLPPELLALQPIPNSDILVVRYFAPAGINIADAGFTVTGAGGTQATLTPKIANTEVTRGLDKGGAALFGIADCAQATIFAGTLLDVGTGAIDFRASNSGTNKVGFGGVEAYQPNQAVLYRAESIVYYVRPGAGGGPSLWRASWNGSGAYAAEELVEGVESLQFLYGRDRSGVAQRPTGYISRNSVASDIGGALAAPTGAQADDWRRVGMVQVGMLMRSSEPAAAARADNSPSVLGVSITPPTTGGHYRSVYETSIALRNRLYGN